MNKIHTVLDIGDVVVELIFDLEVIIQSMAFKRTPNPSITALYIITNILYQYGYVLLGIVFIIKKETHSSFLY